MMYRRVGDRSRTWPILPLREPLNRRPPPCDSSADMTTPRTFPSPAPRVEPTVGRFPRPMALGLLTVALAFAGCGARANDGSARSAEPPITRPGSTARAEAEMHARSSEPGPGASEPANGDAEDLPKPSKPAGSSAEEAASAAASRLSEDWPAGPQVPGRRFPATGRQVVVLLPLSGRSARLGVELATGLEAARGGTEDPGPDFVIRDSPDGESAATQIREIADGPGVAGVVGLFDRGAGDTVAATAAEVGLPAVLVTPAEGATAHPGLVWRALHTPSLVVRTVAGAGLARGGREAVILRPRTPAGESFAGLFRGVWGAGGGFISGEIDYDAAKPDWKQVAQRLSALPGDTIFFPDSPVNAAQALATLASAGLWSKSPTRHFAKSKVREFIVLGTPEWYSADVMRQSGRYFEGSLFPVAFATESVSGARFAARYSLAGHAPPTAIDALLWEAVFALDKAVRRAEAEGGTIAAALARETSDEATVGLRFDAPDAVQSLYVLTLRDGRFAAAR